MLIVLLNQILTVNFNVVRMNHGYEFVERSVDLLTTSVNSQSDCSCLGDAAEIVGFLLPILSVPAHVELVCQDTSSHGGAVVPAKTDQHHSQFGYTRVGFEDHGVGAGDSRVAAVTENREDVTGCLDYYQKADRDRTKINKNKTYA